MITIIGVPKEDRRRVAAAIVRTLGVVGVCDKEPKCPALGGDSCTECAANNYVKCIEAGGDASD